MAPPVETAVAKPERYQSFAAFWPYYMSEHRNPVNRRLHFVGTTLALLALLAAVVLRRPALLGLAPVMGYGFAWVGHFFVERNRPATFTYPLWSLMGDFRLYGQMWLGKAWK